MVRLAFYEYMNKHKKKLKRVRMNEYELRLDELTNQILIMRSSSFSHIRSVAVFPELADQSWNGLVVNEETHNIITENGVNDEDRLLDLCKYNEWNTNWYSNFLDNLGDNQYYSD